MTEQKNPDNVIDREPILKRENKIEKPRMYRCIFLNDDFTTVEFVVEMLQKYFHHNLESAISLAKEVHEAGKGVAGVYTYEVAETKAYEVMQEAVKREFPLQVVIAPIQND